MLSVVADGGSAEPPTVILRPTLLLQSLPKPRQRLNERSPPTSGGTAMVPAAKSAITVLIKVFVTE